MTHMSDIRQPVKINHETKEPIIPIPYDLWDRLKVRVQTPLLCGLIHIAMTLKDCIEDYS